MPALTPNAPPISPDGRFWWDGQAWQPLYSPDGMWRWSGQAWVPLAEPFGAEAVPVPQPAVTEPAPAYGAAPASESPPAWLDASAAAILNPPPAVVVDPVPVPAYVPPPRMGSRPFIYLGGALLVGAIVLTGWISETSCAPSRSTTPRRSPRRHPPLLEASTTVRRLS